MAMPTSIASTSAQGLKRFEDGSLRGACRHVDLLLEDARSRAYADEISARGEVARRERPVGGGGDRRPNSGGVVDFCNDHQRGFERRLLGALDHARNRAVLELDPELARR